MEILDKCRRRHEFLYFLVSKVSAKVEFPVVMERDEKQYHTFFEGGKIQEARKPWHRG